MKKLFLFFFILLVGCANKSIVKDSTYTKVEQTRVIDTTLKILNPVFNLVAYNDYMDSINIEFKDYRFKSSVDLETGTRKYEFIPLKDSIKVHVKVKQKTSEITQTDSETVIKKRVSLKIYLLIGFAAFVTLYLLRCYLKQKLL